MLLAHVHQERPHTVANLNPETICTPRYEAPRARLYIN